MHVSCSNYGVPGIVTHKAPARNVKCSDDARPMLAFTSLPRGFVRCKDSQTACTMWTAVPRGGRRAGTKETEAGTLQATSFKVIGLENKGNESEDARKLMRDNERLDSINYALHDKQEDSVYIQA
jgi:hypothetical protein